MCIRDRIYIETLPSTSWPISKNYWDTSEYDVIKADPVSGEIDIDFSQSSKLQMRVEHGIKEASTEVFLYKINKLVAILRVILSLCKWKWKK